MPLKQCSVDGKSGWKWGDSGHCYPGKSGKKLALKQGVAAEGPEKFKEIIDRAKASDRGDYLAALREHERENPPLSYAEELVTHVQASLDADPEYDAAYAYVSQEQRQKIPAEDFGWPEKKKFPITSPEEVESASRLLGRAKCSEAKRAEIKARIIAIAKRKGFALPKSWVA